jgi:hypothetical protein
MLVLHSDIRLRLFNIGVRRGDDVSKARGDGWRFSWVGDFSDIFNPHHMRGGWRPGAGRPVSTTWTKEMDEALIDLRSKGTTLLECAELIGVYHQNVGVRARELGVAQRMNRGRMNGRDALGRLEPL